MCVVLCFSGAFLISQSDGPVAGCDLLNHVFSRRRERKCVYSAEPDFRHVCLDS